jgi:hypothetical protein
VAQEGWKDASSEADCLAERGGERRIDEDLIHANGHEAKKRERHPEVLALSWPGVRKGGSRRAAAGRGSGRWRWLAVVGVRERRGGELAGGGGDGRRRSGVGEVDNSRTQRQRGPMTACGECVGRAMALWRDGQEDEQGSATGGGGAARRVQQELPDVISRLGRCVRGERAGRTVGERDGRGSAQQGGMVARE